MLPVVMDTVAVKEIVTLNLKSTQMGTLKMTKFGLCECTSGQA